MKKIKTGYWGFLAMVCFVLGIFSFCQKDYPSSIGIFLFVITAICSVLVVAGELAKNNS